MLDLIERSQAIEALQNTSLRVTGIRNGKTILAQCAEAYRNDCVEAVNSIPSASEYELVRHGYWINCGKNKHGTQILQCSYCKKTRKGAGRSKYCRDCGAHMDISMKEEK